MAGFFIYSVLISPTYKNTLLCLFGSCCVFCGFLAVDLFARYKTCSLAGKSLLLSAFQRPVYFAIQKKYWDVGFLCILPCKQSFQSFVGTSSSYLFGFWKLFHTSGSTGNKKYKIMQRKEFPHIVPLALYACLSACCCACPHHLPTVFFLASRVLVLCLFIFCQKHASVLYISVLYFCCYSVLFAHFYPPC